MVKRPIYKKKLKQSVPDRVLPRSIFFPYSCDYLAEAIANVNDKAEIKCILDGPDLLPYWVHDTIGKKHALKKYDQFALNTSCFLGSNFMKLHNSAVIFFL